METRSRFIAPHRMGAWVVTALGVAVVALIVAVFGLRESRVSAVVTQVEVMKLNDRIKSLEMKEPKAMAPAAEKAAAPK